MAELKLGPPNVEDSQIRTVPLSCPCGQGRSLALTYRTLNMPLQIIKRRSRGFIYVNAHPEGCRRNVERWVAGVRGKIPADQAGPKNVLVVGASTGYGLASRIAAAWGTGAKTLGVFFERPPEGDKTATAGHYNTVAFHSLAQKDGLFATSINGDAFSEEANGKQQKDHT